MKRLPRPALLDSFTFMEFLLLQNSQSLERRTVGLRIKMKLFSSMARTKNPLTFIQLLAHLSSSFFLQKKVLLFLLVGFFQPSRTRCFMIFWGEGSKQTAHLVHIHYVLLFHTFFFAHTVRMASSGA